MVLIITPSLRPSELIKQNETAKQNITHIPIVSRFIFRLKLSWLYPESQLWDLKSFTVAHFDPVAHNLCVYV